MKTTLIIPDGTGHSTKEVTNMAEFEHAVRLTPTALFFDKTNTQIDRGNVLEHEEVLVVGPFVGG